MLAEIYLLHLQTILRTQTSESAAFANKARFVPIAKASLRAPRTC